ncbi:MAG: glycine--tRNA ligase [Candidatus Poseidoniia archaeon]|nr:glycine--tRNA ligase [Candidatus Poseidoniia archaeon]
MNFKEVMALAKRRGIFQPAYEPYGGVAGLLDYGPIGVRLRRKILELWRQQFVIETGALELEGATIGPEALFRASGHLSEFDDLVVECSECKKLYRADRLIEGGDALGKKALIAEVAKNTCGGCEGVLGMPRPFNLMFTTSIGAGRGAVGYLRPETAQGIFQAFPWLLRQNRGKLPLAAAQVGRAFRNEIAPRQGPLRLREFTQMEVESFFLPGAEADLPENISEVVVSLLPDVGKAIEAPVSKALAKGIIASPQVATWLARCCKFILDCGVPPEKLRFRQHGQHEMAHYSSDCWDGEVKTSAGWIEVVGIAHRGDYDLRAHAIASGREMRVPVGGKSRLVEHWIPDRGAIGRKFKSAAKYILEQLEDDVAPGVVVEVGGKKTELGIDCFTQKAVAEQEMVFPLVVEPSFGLDRLLYSILETTWRSEGDRGWLALPEAIGPYVALVAPLMNRDGMRERARGVCGELRQRGVDVYFDGGGSIGRRYARADEIGVPLAITIDHQTMDDGTVTVRERDTMSQVRKSAERI